MKSRMGRKEMRAFVNVLARRKLNKPDAVDALLEETFSQNYISSMAEETFFTNLCIHYTSTSCFMYNLGDQLEEHDQDMWVEDAVLHYKYERLRLSTKS